VEVVGEEKAGRRGWAVRVWVGVEVVVVVDLVSAYL
jgi:hypothetical protein